MVVVAVPSADGAEEEADAKRIRRTCCDDDMRFFFFDPIHYGIHCPSQERLPKKALVLIV